MRPRGPGSRSSGKQVPHLLRAGSADRRTESAAVWWDGFYADRGRPVPFFATKPDENLVSYLDRRLVAPGRALDLGCGPGRNALFLAARGFEVDAVDHSPAAIDRARERAREAAAPRPGGAVRFHCGDAFALTESELCGPYDLVHDSGCFHHLPPRRRVSDLALLERVPAPRGHFALTCFAAGRRGSGLPDAAFSREPGPHGGIACTPESLRPIFHRSAAGRNARAMRREPEDSPLFGEDFLWAALFPTSRAAGGGPGVAVARGGDIGNSEESPA